MTTLTDERIVTTWFGDTMPRLHALCIASWLANGHRAIIYSYRDSISGLPAGAEIVDATTVVSQEHMFFATEGIYAHFSDIFRMELLKQGLGVWCDADYMVLRPFPEFDEVMIGRERGDWPCNAIMWMPGDHPIAAGVLENFYRGGLSEWSIAKSRLRHVMRRVRGETIQLQDYPNGHWGRHALTYYVRRLGIADKLQPQDRFFAPETYTGELFVAGDHSRVSDNPEVSGIHFFEKSRQHDEPEPGSFYAWASDRFAGHL